VKHPASSGSPPALAHLRDDLAALEAESLLRVPPPPLPGGTLVFCSNDYLGLAPRLAEPVAAGSGASRLVSGNSPEHTAVEASLAAWLRLEAAIVFSSGYAANVGAVSALAGPRDLIVSDQLNHASIIDGCRLSRARVQVVPHNDVPAVASALATRTERRAWVITESYFSMDADGPDLPALRSVCDEHGAALFVDEAHALGVLGPDGRGRSAEAGVVPDVLVGTFGKSFGSSGAFVAGSADLRLWLWNRARSFVFSTGLSPAVAVAARRAIALAQGEPALRRATIARAGELRDGLSALGLPPLGFGHIVPVLIGDSARALRIAQLLLERGVFVSAIRPPTVPRGTARLRFTVTAAHTAEDVAHALRAVRDALLQLAGES
jgi:8-amino-7-oxononanoate synthase